MVLRLSQRAKTEKSHFLPEDSIFFKILLTPFLSTWMQTCWTPARSNVVLVRRTYDFWFFFCWFSGFAAITKKKVEKCHISKNNHFYSNYFTNTCLSTWMQTFLSPARPNVVLVRRNFDFCVFFCHIGPKKRSRWATIQKKNTKQDVAKNRLGVWGWYFVGVHSYSNGRSRRKE